MVQVRWGHINRDYSLLTQVQSVLLDGHFILEHGGPQPHRPLLQLQRHRRASGGATAIEDAGGWQHDTLTEDLDLSYRAQMKGWRFVFLQDVVSPAEIPVEMNAFKSQQHRWAKGSVQTCKKLLPAILASKLPLAIKIEAVFHLTANFAYPLMVLLSLLMFPAMVIRYNMGWYEMMIVDVPLFLGATMSVCSFYLMSQREIFGDAWKSRIKYLPAVLAVGIGLSVNNAKAVIEALLGHESEFTRTPKYRVEGAGDEWKQKRYRGTLSFVPFVELLLGLYFTAMAGYALRQRDLRHPALHPDLPGRLPLRGDALALPERRQAGSGPRSRRRRPGGARGPAWTSAARRSSSSAATGSWGRRWPAGSCASRLAASPSSR